VSVERFRREELVAAPWKNGGGLTREIVCRPRGSSMDTFDWRVSIAEISADGAFSVFGGVDRVIVLLSGPGVQLRSNDGRIEHSLNDPLVPFSFSGDDAITASLIGDASSDFNVMTRRATTRVEVRVVGAGETLAECSGGVLLAARGTWSVTAIGHRAGGTPYALETGAGLWWDDEPLVWELNSRDAGAALIAVRVRHRDARDNT
jgi:hypothetical protein